MSDHNCFDCDHPVSEHSGQREATGCRRTDCDCKRWFEVQPAKVTEPTIYNVDGIGRPFPPYGENVVLYSDHLAERQRWKQEVRERLESRETRNAVSAARRKRRAIERETGAYPPQPGKEIQLDFTAALDAIFGACETCGDSGVVHTGECLEAMSGPTCSNPACPPCQTPETEQCADCDAATEGTRGHH